MHCFALKNSLTPAGVRFFHLFGFVDFLKLSLDYQVHHAFVKLAVPKNLRRAVPELLYLLYLLYLN